MKKLLLILLLAGHGLYAKPAVQHLTLVPTKEMTRAELYLWKPEKDIRAVMVFCPGHSGSGESFVRSKMWQQFASDHHLALCGIYFDGDMAVTEQAKGYSYAERGAGKILLDTIDGHFGDSKYPLLLYGYSAGARFVTSFLAWKPLRVLTWCASGVGTWPPLPSASASVAPGIVACGEYDGACYGSSLFYFQDGRKRNYPWTYITLENLGHDYSSVLDAFVIRYFETMLTAEKPLELAAAYFDISTKLQLFGEIPSESLIFSSWLPLAGGLPDLWKQVHYP